MITFLPLLAVYCTTIAPMLLADGAPDRPSPAPQVRPAPTVQPSIYRIVAAAGMVEMRDCADGTWRKCEIDMEVRIGSQFRVGPRAFVHVRPPRGSDIVMDRLGTVTLANRPVNSNRPLADGRIHYGRTRYDITTGGTVHESTIRSPNSTLVIRGHVPVVTHDANGEIQFGSECVTFYPQPATRPKPAQK